MGERGKTPWLAGDRRPGFLFESWSGVQTFWMAHRAVQGPSTAGRGDLMANLWPDLGNAIVSRPASVRRRVLRDLRCLSVDYGPRQTERLCELIREAIRRKEEVLALLDDRLVIFCPHALASGPAGMYVLALMVIDDRDIIDEEFSSPKRWRWLSVPAFTAAMRRQGCWFSAPPESRPPLASARIELEAA